MTSSRQILRSHAIPKKPATPPGEIVLREWEPGMWATHFHNLEAGGYFDGRYFDNLPEAEADFEKRIKNWGYRPEQSE